MIRFEKNLLDRKKKYTIAFSGGEDSLTVAAFLKAGGYNLDLLHVIHNYDKDSSEKIFSGVECAANYLGLPLKVIENTHLNFPQQQSPEFWCAAVRYQAFREHKGNIIVCHTLDDVVEKYLMNCFKGRPLTIPYEKVSALDSHTCLIRPFLMTSKEDFSHYLAPRPELHKLIVPDEMQSMRGYLRKEVIPHIPGLGQTVQRLFYS